MTKNEKYHPVSKADELIRLGDIENIGDPAPKYLRTGHSIKMTTTLDNDWKIFEWSHGKMASDIMIDIDALNDGKIRYQSGFGDINYYKNVLLNESDSSIEVYRGEEWTFLDFYSIRSGNRINVDGKINLKTYGYGYRLSGLLKLLKLITKNEALDLLQKHIEVQYNYSDYDESPGHPLKNTKFDAWSITIKDIDKLFLSIIK